ncbi:MAG: phenylalanine--tRNA ligase subunit beta [Desulfococcaceae bacterium]
MKVSLSWLRSYVDVEMDVAEMAERLTRVGLEVDSVVDRFAWLADVRVGRVTEVSPHPNADRLSLCTVDSGVGAARVVCGAPNVRPGMLVPFAAPGVRFPTGRVLEKSAIRGETSEGMLCAAAELDLGGDASGLLELDAGLSVGAPLNEALGLRDPVLEIELTPNRPDCLGVLGVAREVAAFEGKRVRPPEFSMPPAAGSVFKRTSVTIEDPEHCPRYAARMVENVAVGPSPDWLRDRLVSVGLRPINNLVDVTNFVMMETGQPLHAFDHDRLEEGRIVVRTAEEGEKFTTLDGKERTLAGDMLMICDGKRPVAVGGVMGGLNSEIEDQTRNVLIESAHFDPVSIRRTAKRLGLSTDASHRFERGVDPEGTLRALDRAAALVAELGEGTLLEGTVDERPIVVGPKPIALGAAAVNRHLGTRLDREEIAQYLRSIEFEAIPEPDPDRLTVTPPSFRVDVTRPEDLMEEVARLWGYDRIPVTFPALPAEGAPPAPRVELRNRLRDRMAGFGFAEVVSYSFIDPAAMDRLRIGPEDDRRRQLPILNPISEEMAAMRTTLLPGLLDAARRNLAHGNRDLRLFEVGKVFFGNGSDRLPDEFEWTGGLWTGLRAEAGWHTPAAPCDFFDLKGALEALLTGLGAAGVRFSALPDADCDALRPGHAAVLRLDGAEIGRIGEVHPEARAAYDLGQPVFVFELNLEAIAGRTSDLPRAEPLPRFPAVYRDVTLVLDRGAEAADVLDRVRESGEPLVEDVWLFDVYAGEKIPAGRKSLSLRIVYRSPEETLTDERVSPAHERISAMLLSSFDAAFPGESR